MDTDSPPPYDYGVDAPDVAGLGYDFGGTTSQGEASQVDVELAEAFLELLTPARYKVFYGGRGSAKSWQFARALVLLAVTGPQRILCCREYQTSIAESVHYTLADQIQRMGLSAWFIVQKDTITCPTTGSEFIFKGLRLHINEIKSLEGVTICWIDEGQGVSRYSLNTLDPTIRALNSEIWISYNPLNDNDPVHDRFVIKGLPEYDTTGKRYAIVREVNYTENPWFPPDLETMRLRMQNEDQDIYANVWQGKTLQVSDAMIFRNKWEVADFTAPEGARFHFGADWGFARDPSVLVRCYVHDSCLWIDYEAFGVGVELDELCSMFAGDDTSGSYRWDNARQFGGLPGAQEWPIMGDNSRPETISYLRRSGLNVSAARKWPGSVEDGITHLRGFRKIYIHRRCTKLQEEALLYRYKVDRTTQQVLPVIVDAYNHGWDAVRYALDGYIQQRGVLGVWAALNDD